MMDAEINKILFGAKPPPPRASARVKARSERAAEILENIVSRRRQERETGDEEAVHMSVADALHGVTVSWLSQVFNMDPATVKKRLRDCPPMHRRKTGFTYDLKAACQYLVKPNFDIDQYMKTMKVSEMPTHLQEAYWSAMTKRQQWEEKAGQLWRTDAVLEVLGDVFQTIKFTMQLWPENIERSTGLSGDQRVMLVRMLDAMQQELHGKLVEMPKMKQTPPSLAEGATDGPPPDDYSHLI